MPCVRLHFAAIADELKTGAAVAVERFAAHGQMKSYVCGRCEKWRRDRCKRRVGDAVRKRALPRRVFEKERKGNVTCSSARPRSATLPSPGTSPAQSLTLPWAAVAPTPHHAPACEVRVRYVCEERLAALPLGPARTAAVHAQMSAPLADSQLVMTIMG